MRGGDYDLCALSNECVGRGKTKAAAASRHEVDPVTQSEIHESILAQRRRGLDSGCFARLLVRLPKRTNVGCCENMPATSASPSPKWRASSEILGSTNENESIKCARSVAEFIRMRTKLSHWVRTLSCTLCGLWVDTRRCSPTFLPPAAISTAWRPPPKEREAKGEKLLPQCNRPRRRLRQHSVGRARRLCLT